MKYGIPEGVDPVEIREKIDKIFHEFDEKRKDPEFQRIVARNARIAGYVSAEDLDRPFTI